MPILFYYPTKIGAAQTWAPTSADPVWPNIQPVDYPMPTAKSAGGVRYVQDKGVKEESFFLRFELMDVADRNSYLAFFNTVKKSLNSFEYEDKDLFLHTVKIMNAFDFEENLPGLYNGSIELEKQ